MCGIIGIATSVGHRPSVGDEALLRARDRMTHRGPHGAGLLSPAPHVTLAHRRLAIVDTSEAGHQPMVSTDGTCTLAYNGMLYNDADLRSELGSRGNQFVSACDTETVLLALRQWGVNAFARLRGMFAVAFFDNRDQSLTLARDPLGIKPMYYVRREVAGVRELLFASELRALRELPGVSRAPDLVTASAYLTTIRNTLDDRTLYANIKCVRPGEWLRFDLASDQLRVERGTTWPEDMGCIDAGEAVERVRSAVIESVRLHCRADVPVCALLSGGLDSAITTSVARQHVADLRTYCAGDPHAPPIAGIPQSDDFAHARLVAEQLGTTHTEVPIDRALFERAWPGMIAQLGAPLSTPNEIAIRAVASTLAADGHRVAISGEGADELFAGYAAPMAAAAAHVEAGNTDPGVFQLLSNAWTPIEMKPAVFTPDAWAAAEHDVHLVETYRSTWDTLAVDRRGATDLEVHLRFHRRINLAGLLARLDTSTMLASVEGRTPFADAMLARLAESLPMTAKYQGDAQPPATKTSLRRAFAAALPDEIVQRPKASFPLPFQHWMASHAASIGESDFMRATFSEAALATVASDPASHWALAWPMINLSLWDRSR